MSEHTQTPWMTQPCGELCPEDVMIVADCGKFPNGTQRISTVAKALSIRQTKETTAANAAFIVKAVNNHDALVKLLQATQGRIMNAKIDLGSGHTKAQVERTLNGIIEFVDGALALLKDA